MIRKTFIVAVASLALAGCLTRGPSETDLARQKAIQASLSDRDEGRTTWRQWSAIWRELYLNGKTPAQEEMELIHAVELVAERVDTKKMTPAEGRLTISQTQGQLIERVRRRIEASELNESIRAVNSAPAPRFICVPGPYGPRCGNF